MCVLGVPWLISHCPLQARASEKGSFSLASWGSFWRSVFCPHVRCHSGPPPRPGGVGDLSVPRVASAIPAPGGEVALVVPWSHPPLGALRWRASWLCCWPSPVVGSEETSCPVPLVRAPSAFVGLFWHGQWFPLSMNGQARTSRAMRTRIPGRAGSMSPHYTQTPPRHHRKGVSNVATGKSRRRRAAGSTFLCLHGGQARQASAD